MDTLDYHLIQCPWCKIDIFVQKNDINCTILDVDGLKQIGFKWIRMHPKMSARNTLNMV